MARSVMQMRKGKHLGPMTPLSGGLIKQGKTMYGKNAEKQVTTGQNPGLSMKHSGSVIKQGNNIPKC